MADRIRWGILSTANIGRRRFIPALAHARNGVVTAIASRDGERARQVAEELHIPRAHTSYEALLADPEVDAIYNPLPNSMHAEWTLKAAAAGKHILCEKPLAVNAAEAAEMVAGCHARGVVLMEAFMYRFHPQQARVAQLIADGAIGEVRQVRSSFTFHLDPLNPKNVRLQGWLAGGALMDVGCYAVNSARWLFGEEPTEVIALADMRPEFNVDVALAGVLEFSGRRLAVIDCSFRAYKSGTYTVVGTKGQIQVPDAYTPEPDAETLVIVTDAAGRREERIAPINQYTLEAEEFADALLQGRPLRIPPEDGVANMRVIDALYRSVEAHGVRQEVL